MLLCGYNGCYNSYGGYLITLSSCHHVNFSFDGGPGNINLIHVGVTWGERLNGTLSNMDASTLGPVLLGCQVQHMLASPNMEQSHNFGGSRNH